MFPLIKCNDRKLKKTERAAWKDGWLISECWLINASDYVVWIHVGESVHSGGTCESEREESTGSLLFTPTSPVHNIETSTTEESALTPALVLAHTHTHTPSVSASPSSCPPCPAASSPSTGRRSRMGWCRTSGPPSRRPCRGSEEPHPVNVLVGMVEVLHLFIMGQNWKTSWFLWLKLLWKSETAKVNSSVN